MKSLKVHCNSVSIGLERGRGGSMMRSHEKKIKRSLQLCEHQTEEGKERLDDEIPCFLYQKMSLQICERQTSEGEGKEVHVVSLTAFQSQLRILSNR